MEKHDCACATTKCAIIESSGGTAVLIVAQIRAKPKKIYGIYIYIIIIYLLYILIN